MRIIRPCKELLEIYLTGLLLSSFLRLGFSLHAMHFLRVSLEFSEEWRETLDRTDMAERFGFSLRVDFLAVGTSSSFVKCSFFNSFSELFESCLSKLDWTDVMSDPNEPSLLELTLLFSESPAEPISSSLSFSTVSSKVGFFETAGDA